MSRPLITQQTETGKSRQRPRPIEGKKFYICLPCVKGGTPFMVPTDEDGMKEYEEHMAGHEAPAGKQE